MAIRLTESKLRQIIREEIEDLGAPGSQMPPAENYPMVIGKGYTHVFRGARSHPTYSPGSLKMSDGSPVPRDAQSFMAVAPFILVDVKGNGNFRKLKLVQKVHPSYLSSPHIEELLYAAYPNVQYLSPSRAGTGTTAVIQFSKH